MAEAILFKGGDFVKTAFTSMLRTAFAAQTFLPNYVYSDNEHLTKIGIFESFPKRTLVAPSLIVSMGGSAMEQGSISDFDHLRTDSVANPDATKTSYSYGTWTGTVIISVAGITDADRRLLRDLTMLFCRHLFRVYTAQMGIGYKDVRSTGEEEIDWQGQRLYIDRITIPCYSEFQISYNDELVSKLNLTVNSLLGTL